MLEQSKHACDTKGPFGSCGRCWKNWLPECYTPLATSEELAVRAKIQGRTKMAEPQSPTQCNHDLAERETACADGMCPLCLSAAVKAETKRLRQALEEIDEMARMAKSMNEYGMIHQAGDVARAALEKK